MEINNLLFQAVAQLTGGLITDMTSLLLGMVTLFFLAIGFDKIRDVIVADLRRSNDQKLISEMRKQQYIFQNEDLFDDLTRDIAKARYRRSLGRLSD